VIFGSGSFRVANFRILVSEAAFTCSIHTYTKPAQLSWPNAVTAKGGFLTEDNEGNKGVYLEPRNTRNTLNVFQIENRES